MILALRVKNIKLFPKKLERLSLKGISALAWYFWIWQEPTIEMSTSQQSGWLCLTHKYEAWLERFTRRKCSSLSSLFISDHENSLMVLALHAQIY